MSIQRFTQTLMASALVGALSTLILMRLVVVLMGMFGLSIKAKASGSWQAVKPWAKAGGSWVAARVAWVKVAGNWKKSYEYDWAYTFASGEFTDVDIDTLSGIDKYHNVTITIPASTTLVGSTTSAYALKTGSGYGGTLTIINHGKILGRGGNAGNGGATNAGYHGGAGGNGGDAIHIEDNVTINNNGIIIGGGGGGGGGGAVFYNAPWYESDDYAGGGGGGGGAPYGTAGSGGYPSGNAGTAATITASGNGGASRTADDSYSGAGGNGGPYSANGIAGNYPTGYISIGGNGGAAGTTGAAYYNPSNHTVTQV